MSQATYRHEWEAPYIVALETGRGEGKAPERVWTVRQECRRCGTQRNPLTNRITRFRGAKHPETGLHECQRDEAPPYRWAEHEKRLVQSLQALAADGHLTRAYHPDTEGADALRLL